MDFFRAALLGVVQGLTEFLPVSSSGHLVVVQKLIGIPEHDLAFDVAVHLGTLFSLFTIYGRSIFNYSKDVIQFSSTRNANNGSKALVFVVLGSIPTALIGFSLRQQFHALFSNLTAVGICLLITAILLFITHRLGRVSQISGEISTQSLADFEGFTWWKALIVGTVQGMAIAPGISRSGATIAGAMLLGVSGDVAARFSFLLAIPAMIGAALLELRGVSWEPGVFSYLAVGFVLAYLSGVFALWLVLRLVSKGRLHYFSPYLVLLALGLLIWQIP